MKKISCILFCIFLNIHALTKTSYFEYDSSPETPTYISENNNYQELEPREVAVNSTINAQLHQFFVYDGSIYKDIQYSEFSKKYNQIANEFIQVAIIQSKLSWYERKNHGSYKIVGEEPLDTSDPLYDCKVARDTLIIFINKFIDENEEKVRQQCIGYQLQEHTSKVVWAPGCCDIQLHKNCFQQCKKSNITKCINLFCENSTWTPAFYAKVMKNRRAVHINDLYNSDCPVCLEPLKTAEKNNAEDTSSIGTGIVVPAAKKTRLV